MAALLGQDFFGVTIPGKVVLGYPIYIDHAPSGALLALDIPREFCIADALIG